MTPEQKIWLDGERKRLDCASFKRATLSVFYLSVIAVVLVSAYMAILKG